MNITPYHAKYFAHELTRQGGQGIDRLDRALFDACVDLNPHQIEAAIFALRSPISKGVLLADEVGLGKTIEAGLVLCQLWAERRRQILVICPASLRKQWALELEEKFNLPSVVLDAKAFNQMQKDGKANPLQQNVIIIMSFHYAARRAEELKLIPWHMIVIDEAHKLRNAYRQSNRIGQTLRWATSDRRKCLLTATPLQNSLLELYGLSTLIDEKLFGDLASFRTQYLNTGGDLNDLRDRLQSFTHRTLRRQVQEYIKYTQRKLITRPFKPTEQEQKLYEAISTFLQREKSYALPKGQRHLIILLVRKVLASSPRAVASTLSMIRDRLKDLRKEALENADLVEKLIMDEELDDDLLDELLEDQEDALTEAEEASAVTGAEAAAEEAEEDKVDIKRLDAEIEELDRYITWANSIGVDTKTRQLLKALEIGFERMTELEAQSKAVIFTESRKTQAYLKDFLESNGYAGQVLTFNGTNRDPDSQVIYQNWLEKNKDTGRVSNSRPVDIRTALIDHFRDSARILIATEAAAEGINLQFCSLVINYDLPWNPQRIEQRIGRCHRYGQKHDVVVINFLNERNHADIRVYELLEHKFNLFSGVFGASDEVLGSLASGIDFEQRVLEIYQSCRTTKEIQKAFTQLQAELDEQIQTKMQNTRKKLLEYFDEEVHDRLKINLSGARERLGQMERMFWNTTQFILDSFAEFDSNALAFFLRQSPITNARSGYYKLISKNRENNTGEFLYRLSHPLGEYVIDQGMKQETPHAHVTYDVTNHPTHISVVEQLVGKSGWLTLKKLRIDSFDRDEYLLFSAFDDQGNDLDQETCQKLFYCMAETESLHSISIDEEKKLQAEADRHIKSVLAKSLEENNKHFTETRDQLYKWARDMEIAAEKELQDVKRQIQDMERQSRQAPTLKEQQECLEQMEKLEKKKRQLRQKIFDVEDEIDSKRKRLLNELEQRMQQKTQITPLFTIRWSVV